MRFLCFLTLLFYQKTVAQSWSSELPYSTEFIKKNRLAAITEYKTINNQTVKSLFEFDNNNRLLRFTSYEFINKKYRPEYRQTYSYVGDTLVNSEVWLGDNGNQSIQKTFKLFLQKNIVIDNIRKEKDSFYLTNAIKLYLDTRDRPDSVFTGFDHDNLMSMAALTNEGFYKNKLIYEYSGDDLKKIKTFLNKPPYSLLSVDSFYKYKNYTVKEYILCLKEAESKNHSKVYYGKDGRVITLIFYDDKGNESRKIRYKYLIRNGTAIVKIED